MKIYVASSFLNKSAARRAMRLLQKDGHTITSRWTAHRPSTKTRVLHDEAIKDLQDVRAAQAMVVIWPGRLGTSAEIGAALISGKPVHMVGAVPTDQSVYFNHPLVTVWPKLQSLRKHISPAYVAKRKKRKK